MWSFIYMLKDVSVIFGSQCSCIRDWFHPIVTHAESF